MVNRNKKFKLKNKNYYLWIVGVTASTSSIIQVKSTSDFWLPPKSFIFFGDCSDDQQGGFREVF